MLMLVSSTFLGLLSIQKNMKHHKNVVWEFQSDIILTN